MWPALQHSCTACVSYRPYSFPCHRCIRGLMPHHSCYCCASSGRGPGSGRGYQPRPSGDREFERKQWGFQWCTARPPRDPSLLSWPWGSSPSGSGGLSSAVGLTALPIVNSHAESAAMLADPMVGYWCRVGSLALTHTRTDIFGAVAICGSAANNAQHFCCPAHRPHARLLACQDWSLLLRECGQGLVPWSEVVSGCSSPLVCLFVCSECMPVMSCIGPQSPAWVVGLLPNATNSSPHNHFDGIRVVS